MADSITFSIIIPVKPGGTVRALHRLRSVAYPSSHMEVLVAEGTRPSRQRNQAAAAAAGEMLYFLDDDSLASPDFLARAAAHLADPSVAAVGGPSLTPASDSRFQRAIGVVLASRLGGGGARNRYRATGSPRRTSERELILCNLAMRRDVFLAEGGLDERLYPNEENELMDRISKRGMGLVHDPDLAVRRSQRSTFRAFVRQFFGYGRGRGEQTRIAGVRSVVDFLPTVFLIYLLLLPVAPWAPCFLPAALYGAAVMVSALSGAVRSRLYAALPWLVVLYPTLHLCYGAGLLKGLLTPRFRSEAGETAAVTIRCIKEFGAPWHLPAHGTGEVPQ